MNNWDLGQKTWSTGTWSKGSRTGGWSEMKEVQEEWEVEKTKRLERLGLRSRTWSTSSDYWWNSRTIRNGGHYKDNRRLSFPSCLSRGRLWSQSWGECRNTDRNIEMQIEDCTIFIMWIEGYTIFMIPMWLQDDRSNLYRKDEDSSLPEKRRTGLILVEKTKGIIFVKTKTRGLIFPERKTRGLIFAETKTKGLIFAETKTRGLIFGKRKTRRLIFADKMKWLTFAEKTRGQLFKTR